MNDDEIDDFEKESSSFADRRRKQRYKQLRGRRDAEHEMWEKWVKGGKKPQDLEPLLTSLDPMIEREAKRRMAGLGGSIPHQAVKGELRKGTVRALELFDPTKGAKLPTHIHNNFKRSTDFITTRRNPKHIPRSDLEKYQQFQNAKEQFKQETGREPTQHEMQALLPKWPPSVIRRLEQGTGQEAFSMMGTGNLDHDEGFQFDKIRSAYLLMKGQMSEDEKKFADMHYPSQGKRQMSVKQIARMMKIPEHKAYRIKERIEKKLAPVVKRS